VFAAARIIVFTKDLFEIVVVGGYPRIWVDVMPGDGPYGARDYIRAYRKIDERKQMPQLSGRQFPYDGDKVLPFWRPSVRCAQIPK
jgi:hypothetical protein